MEEKGEGELDGRMVMGKKGWWKKKIENYSQK